jgi:hypothetical protein
VRARKWPSSFNACGNAGPSLGTSTSFRLLMCRAAPIRARHVGASAIPNTGFPAPRLRQLMGRPTLAATVSHCVLLHLPIRRAATGSAAMFQLLQLARQGGSIDAVHSLGI